MHLNKAQPDHQNGRGNCKISIFVPLEFIAGEAMSIELPRRCPVCKNCKECQFRVDRLSFEENEEHEVILNKLHLDDERKQKIESNPFKQCTQAV
jgi:hypothetical protein